MEVKWRRFDTIENFQKNINAFDTLKKDHFQLWQDRWGFQKNRFEGNGDH